MCESNADVETGCITVPVRTQDYFTGADACELLQETVPEANLFYRIQGENHPGRPTIVFVHGFAESGDVWLCAQNELSACYRTVAIDLRGNGRSTKTPAFPEENGIHYTVALSAVDVHEVLQQLGITENIVMVGHSIGGTYAMRYALLYPDELSRLIVTGTFPVFHVPDCAVEPDCDTNCFNPFTCENGFCDPFGTTQSTVAIVTGPLVDCLNGGGTEQECLGVWGEFIAPIWYSDLCQDELEDAQANLVDAIQAMTVPIISSIFQFAATEDMSAELPNITVPTLITFGSADIVVNPGNSQVIHEAIANSVLVDFVGRSHQMHVTSYKKFDDLINRFINSCEFPESSVVFDQGCCVCPLIQPIDYAEDACELPTPPAAAVHKHWRR